MPKYLLAYHGGATPETTTEEERNAIMQAWGAWMGTLDLVDMGNPIGQTKVVTSDGVTVGDSTNPLTGYSLLNAASIDEAVAAAKGCPIHDSGGSVVVPETMEM